MAVAIAGAEAAREAAYGSVFAWIEMRFIAEASDESADQAIVAAAVWLVVPFPMRSIVFSRTAALAHDALSFHAMTTLPIALALVAVVRLVLRRRWVARVSAGQDPQWRFVPCASTLPGGLPALARTQGPALPMVLATLRPADAPYRAAESLEPRATLPSRTTARS